MQISKLALRELLKVALRFSMALGCAAKNIPAEPARTIEALNRYQLSNRDGIY